MVIAKASRGRVQTTVTFILRAKCTATGGKPCDDRRVAAARPSPGNPVVVEWRYSETLTTVTHPCTVLEQNRCEGGTSAPTTTVSTSPPASPPPTPSSSR